MKPRATTTPASAHTAVVIVNYQTMLLTRDAVASVLAEPEVKEVVVVDNGSGDGSARYLRDAFLDERVRVVESGQNRGFAGGVNLGVGCCRSPLLLVLNSDATLVPGSLATLARVLTAHASTGVAAPAVYRPDGRSLEPRAYGRLPTRFDLVLGKGWARPRHRQGRSENDLGWVSGVAMLLRKVDFLAVGGFDEGFSMYFEDLDLCRRLGAAGKSIRREPAAGVVHLGGESWRSKREQKRRFHESKVRYCQKLGATGLELRWVRLAGVVRTSLIPPSRRPGLRFTRRRTNRPRRL